jgi:hypothetical protein
MDRALQMSHNSGLSYIACQQILSAYRTDGTKRLAIVAEKYLITSDQNEEMKERGLTVFDCIENKFTIVDKNFVDNVREEWNNRVGQKIF